jgi:hypothetical protein
MIPANAHSIRRATADDAAVVKRLAQLDSRPVPTGSVLVGEIDGTAVAALSVSDGSLVADPFAHTSALVHHMRVRARGLRAVSVTPSLRRRLAIGLRPASIPETA